VDWIIGLVFLQVVIIAASTMVSAACALVTYLLVPRRAVSRLRIALPLACLLGFFSVIYIEGGFVAFDIYRYASGHDNNFLSGFYHYPLANGYRLTFFDENPDSMGFVQSPNGQGFAEFDTIHWFHAHGDSVFLKASHNPRLSGKPTVNITFGEAPSPGLAPTGPQMQYFEIDTRTGKLVRYETLDALRSAAALRGISVTPMSLEEASREAFAAAGPGRLFLAILSAPLIAAAVLFLRWLRSPEKAPAAGEA
jgi:hypothetical protein